MEVTVFPGGVVAGALHVPGDKSIAHRWLILAATGRGRSELRALPDALDVRSTARVLAALSPDSARAGLERWASSPPARDEGHRSTTNKAEPRGVVVEVEAEGRGALEAPVGGLDCGNSGTTMRLCCGLLAPASFEAELVGDRSLSKRPMERVAEPLRAMGARIETTDGHAPVTVRGARLRGTDLHLDVPSAQVKGALLLAGVDAEGTTTVHEPAATRDHTERALRALGAPIRAGEGSVSVERFAHDGFAAEVPGDLSSALFVVAAAALTGGTLTIEAVGLNPTRTHALTVLARMGVEVRSERWGEELGEPVGVLETRAQGRLTGTVVAAAELPLVVDEVPILAIVAAFAEGESRFSGAGELRVKESDRLSGVADAIRGLGGVAAVEGDDLVVGGGGLTGGRASSRGDHRMAMAAFVAGVAAPDGVTVEGIDAADVSFPGFVTTMERLGARVA